MRPYLIISICVVLQACAFMPKEEELPPSARRPVLPLPNQTLAPPGTIYQSGSSFDLFMDLRARTVGDILTVVLVERTNASKESSANTAKTTDIDTGLPIFAGRPITSGNNPILNTEIASDSSFSGGADASQSNSLDGSVTVTVIERLPNGNLLVQGEKWITLNQGREFIQLTGVVRPVDIRPDNSIASTKIAEAEITYSGKGTLADSSRPGWLTRFFNSPWMPF